MNYLSKQWEQNSLLCMASIVDWHAVGLHVPTYVNFTLHMPLESSQTYTVMQYIQHLHCHPVLVPRLFLSDRTMTNAWKMAGNILSVEEAIFLWSKEECISKWKLHRQLAGLLHNSTVVKHVCAHVLRGYMAMCCSRPLVGGWCNILFLLMDTEHHCDLMQLIFCLRYRVLCFMYVLCIT